MIGILIPNNLWFCPYVGIYTKILEGNHVPYEIVSWCRDGKVEKGCIQYFNSREYKSSLFKLFAYYRFAMFVKKQIKKRRYKKLIVFTPQLAIFLSRYLKKHFENKYIFDYRDLSIEQNRVFNKAFLCVLNHSFRNVISSPGFKQYLPKGYDYILSHNFDIDVVHNALEEKSHLLNRNDVIDVLAIGGIRDYESNVQVIDALSNKDGFRVRFVGRGPSAKKLEDHAIEIGASNVFFDGYYEKQNEPNIIDSCTFLNIFYPRKPSHDTALSNRFYNSLIYKKPMITTANTTQGLYASHYQVGLAIINCSQLDTVLKSFINELDFKSYCNNCNKLLSTFENDYNKFYNELTTFLSL